MTEHLEGGGILKIYFFVWRAKKALAFTHVAVHTF